MHEPNKMIRYGASFGAWYEVEDPAAHHCRVELVNHRPTYICTIAQRVEDRKIFASFPQQSDYVEFWKQAQEPPQEPRTQSSIRRMIPRPIKKLVRWGRDALKKRLASFDRHYPPYYRRFDAPYYRRLSDDDVVRGRIYRR
jgi:hypothetical protein